MPIYKMILPKPEYLQILKITQQNNGKIKKRQLIDKLKELKIIESVGEKSLSKPAEHGQLKTMLDPMIKMEYVDVNTVGRNSIVSITIQGENTLKIFGNP